VAPDRSALPSIGIVLLLRILRFGLQLLAQVLQAFAGFLGGLIQFLSGTRSCLIKLLAGLLCRAFLYLWLGLFFAAGKSGNPDAGRS